MQEFSNEIIMYVFYTQLHIVEIIKGSWSPFFLLISYIMHAWRYEMHVYLYNFFYLFVNFTII